MKRLLIIGARGFGREVYCLALQSIGYGDEFTVTGFLDDKKSALDGYPGYPPIIDSVEHYVPRADDVFVCALGDVHYKHKYVGMILDKGGKFISLIHSTATISANSTLGRGCIVAPSVSISCDVTIGDFVTLQRRATLGHDAVVGNYAHLNTNSFMGGFSRLGDLSTVWTGGILLPHVTVGDRCVVGAGCVVIRNVPSDTTVYGNPAKILTY